MAMKAFLFLLPMKGERVIGKIEKTSNSFVGSKQNRTYLTNQ